MLAPPVRKRELAAAAYDAGRALVTSGQARWADDQGCILLVPILRHLQNVAVVGVVRLTHRPHTKQTANWFSALQRGGAEHVRRYRELAMRARREAAWQSDFELALA